MRRKIPVSYTHLPGSIEALNSHKKLWADMEYMQVTFERMKEMKDKGYIQDTFLSDVYKRQAEGWTVKLPDEVSDKLWKRTDYTWPCTWFAPRTTGKGAFATAYDVMNNWGANHGAISYGHIGADLITMCSMLRIPVSMHNAVSYTHLDVYKRQGCDYRPGS